MCIYIYTQTYLYGIILKLVSPASIKQKQCQSTIFLLLIKQEDSITFQQWECLIIPPPLQIHWTVNISRLFIHSFFPPALYRSFEAAVHKGSDTEFSIPVSTSQQEFWVLLKIRQHFSVLRPSRHLNKEWTPKYTKQRWHCYWPWNSLKEIISINEKIKNLNII